MSINKIVLYECPICHTRYANRDDAVSCEKSHIIPSGITDYDYKSMNQDPCYPYHILVKFDDDKKIRYVRG